VVSQKFAEKVCVALTVMPVKTGIHKLLKSWIPGRATPDCDPGLPGTTTEFIVNFWDRTLAARVLDLQRVALAMTLDLERLDFEGRPSI
jgi:hypothetical protein